MRTLRCCALLLLVSCSSSDRAPLDLVIRHGTIIDGSGNPWYKGDVGVRGGRIAGIGDLSGIPASRTLDAAGCVVAPGFIDMLGQSEIDLLVDNRAISKISKGITTEVTGEGESAAPVNELTLRDYRSYIRKYGLSIDWTDFDGYFQRLARHRAAVNLASFVGAAQVRKYVVGYEDRKPTADELERMKGLVRDAMRQGALGLSSSLIYPPGSYATTSELIELAKEVAPFGGLYITHIRDEGDQGRQKEAVYEAADIARAASVPVQIWHLKVAARHNWGMMPEIVRLIQMHRDSGIDMTADVYPYVASANALAASLPAWAHDGGTESLLARLRNPDTRTRILADLKKLNFGAGVDFDGIQITYVYNPALRPILGKRLSAVAAMWKREPYDALFELLLADSARTGRVTFSMNEQDLRIAMAQPWVSFDTDYNAVAPDGPFSDSRPHPRTYGSMTRVLGKYVREERVLTLEDAVRKMTSLPAQRVGLRERGLVKQGYWADLVVFNPATVKDHATFEQPHQVSSGIEYTIVNGEIVWERGMFTGKLPGVPLRGPGWKDGNP